MRGSITKRGSLWSVRYDEPGETGRRQRRKGGFGTKREAEAFLAEQQTRIRDGSYATPSALTLGRFLTDEWLPAVDGTVRPLTLAAYRSRVNAYIAPRIGSVRLQALSGGHLNALYRELEQAGLSVSTRRGVHTVLHRALRDATRWGRTVRNVATLADPPALKRSRVNAWTAGELRRFLDHVAHDRQSALWRLAATTGLRRGELCGATWRCLDLDGARLAVEQQLVPGPGGVSFGPPKSARSRRRIALDAETVDALRRHRDAQLLERDFAGAAYSDRDLVFCDPLGGPISPMTLTRQFGEHRKAAGIATGTLHVLRHTAATLALTSGVPVHIVAARLGDDPRTILATYASLLPQSDEIAAERVAAAIC